MFQPWAKPDPLGGIVRQIVQPDVDVPAVDVSLVDCHAAAIGRKLQIRDLLRRTDHTQLFALAVEPDQLRLGCSFSGSLRHQRGSGRGEVGEIGLGMVLHGVADDARFTAEREVVDIEALRYQSAIPPIQQIAGLRIDSIRAGSEDRVFLVGIQRRHDNCVFVELSGEIAG